MRSSKVVNLTRGLHWRFRRAERAVEQECACAWVEYGVSVRDLTLAESIAKRNIQAADREPLAYAEMPGLVFSGKTDFGLIREAHRFAADPETMRLLYDTAQMWPAPLGQ